MAAERHIAFLVEHARMVPVVNGVRIVVAAVRSHIVTLAGLADVTIHHNFTIDCNLDVVTLDHDLLGTPLTKRLMHNPLGRNHAVNRTVHLILMEVSVDGGVMVQDLDLAHPMLGSVNSHRSPDPHTVVLTLAEEAELETVDEILVFLLGVEIALGAITG